MNNLDTDNLLDSDSHEGPPSDPTGSDTPIYYRPWALRGLNGLILICFFMPFCYVSCNNISVLPITGVDFATGYSMNSRLYDMNASPFNIFALIALISAIVSLIIFFKRHYKARLINGLLGTIGALSLIGLYIQFKTSSLDRYLPSNMGENSSTATMRPFITLNFTINFFLLILLFVSIAVLSYRLYREKRNLT